MPSFLSKLKITFTAAIYDSGTGVSWEFGQSTNPTSQGEKLSKLDLCAEYISSDPAYFKFSFINFYTIVCLV